MADNDDGQQGARMDLDPDTVHEGEDGDYLDCPACGSPAPFDLIIEEGHCTGAVDDDTAEAETEGEQTREPACTADLSLELVWDS